MACAAKHCKKETSGLEGPMPLEWSNEQRPRIQNRSRWAALQEQRGWLALQRLGQHGHHQLLQVRHAQAAITGLIQKAAEQTHVHVRRLQTRESLTWHLAVSGSCATHHAQQISCTLSQALPTPNHMLVGSANQQCLLTLLWAMGLIDQINQLDRDLVLRR